ncbi:MAG: acyl-CoA thioesterase [Cytophagales bacterium]|nr:acyl-CoA thioesterase [Cytophagales bacterium]
MFHYEIQVRVRYAETDQMGYVYYGNYATYFEVARVEAMRAIGFSYKKMEEEGVMMPVLELKNQFKSPGYYDELLTIRISIPKLPSLKILFEYEVIGEDGREIGLGETTLVFVNKVTGKPMRMPTELVDLLEPYFIK